LELRIAVSVQKRERSRFRESSEEAGERSEGARQSIDGGLRKLEGAAMGQCRGVAAGAWNDSTGT